MGMFYKVDSPRLVDYSYKFPFKEAMIASNQLNKGIGNDIADVNKLKINAKAYPGDSIGLQQAQQNLNDTQAYLTQQIKEHPFDKSYMSEMLAARANVNNFNAMKNNFENNKIQWDKWTSSTKGNAIVSADQLRKFAIDKNGQTFIKNPTTGEYEITKTTLDLPVLSNANYDDELRKTVNMTAIRVNGGSIKPTSVELNIGGEKINLLKTGKYVNTTRDFWTQVENSGISEDEVLDKVIKSDNNLEKDLKVYQEYDNYYGIDPNSDESKVKQYKDHLSDALALQTGLIKRNDRNSSANYSFLGGGRGGKKTNYSNYNNGNQVVQKPSTSAYVNSSSGRSTPISNNDFYSASNGATQTIDESKIAIKEGITDPKDLTPVQQALLGGEYSNSILPKNASHLYSDAMNVKNTTLDGMGKYLLGNIMNNSSDNTLYLKEDKKNNRIVKEGQSKFIVGASDLFSKEANNGKQASQKLKLSEFSTSDKTVNNAAIKLGSNFHKILNPSATEIPEGNSLTISYEQNGKNITFDVSFRDKAKNVAQYIQKAYEQQLPEGAIVDKKFGQHLAEKAYNLKNNDFEFENNVKATSTSMENNSEISTPVFNMKYTYDPTNTNTKKVEYSYTNIKISANIKNNKLAGSDNDNYLLSTETIRRITGKDVQIKINEGLSSIENNIGYINYYGQTYVGIWVGYRDNRHFWVDKSIGEIKDYTPEKKYTNIENSVKNDFIKKMFNNKENLTAGNNIFSSDATSGTISFLENVPKN